MTGKHSMKKILIIVGILVLISCDLKSQQLPLYNQYMLNGYLINPALAGNDGYTTLSLNARTQWLGVPNAPNNQSFSATTRLLKRSYKVKRVSPKKSVLKPSRSGRVGLGGYVFNDMNGSVSRIGISFSYAYHLWVTRTSQLSFGLGGTFYQFQIKQLDFYDDNEPLVGLGINEPVFVPDADFGIYYQNFHQQKFYVGASVKNVMQSYLKLGNRSLEDFRLLRHYYLTGGYKFELSNVDIEPSLLFKMSSQLAPQLDVNVKVYYMKKYWMGLSFRSNKTFVALFGIVVNRFYFGYAFDYEFSSIMSHTYGSHEFMVSVKLGDNARRFPWLERY